MRDDDSDTVLDDGDDHFGDQQKQASTLRAKSSLSPADKGHEVDDVPEHKPPEMKTVAPARKAAVTKSAAKAPTQGPPPATPPKFLRSPQ